MAFNDQRRRRDTVVHECAMGIKQTRSVTSRSKSKHFVPEWKKERATRIIYAMDAAFYSEAPSKNLEIIAFEYLAYTQP
jgi:hypothetical protein